MATSERPRIEMWFTGETAGALHQVTVSLEAHGAALSTGPWNPFAGGTGGTPKRPWSLVLLAPAGIDPTLVAAIANEQGCEYHPTGGAHRWENSPVGRR